MTFQCVEKQQQSFAPNGVPSTVRVVVVNTHSHGSKRDTVTCSIPFTLSHLLSHGRRVSLTYTYGYVAWSL
jgi:hypothetical protein